MKSIIPRRSVVLISLLAAVACGGSGGALNGRFVIEPAPSRGDFANDSALVKKADTQITALVGHPVSFHFDAALVPRWDAQLEALSEGSIDAVAHELAEMKRITPDLFTWMAPALQRVEWDYSAVDANARYTFDPSAHTLRIVLTSNECCVVHEDFIRFAVGRAHAAALANRFDGATPAGVDSSDRGAYAGWLLGPAYGEESKAHPPKGDDAQVDRPHAHVLLETLRLRETVRGQDPALEAKLDARLVDEGAYLAHTRRESAELIAHLPADHDFPRAEAAYVAWLDRSEATLPDRARVKIADEIVTSTQDDGSVRAFMGFDVIGYSLRVFDQWAKAGAPTKAARDEERPRQELFDLVVAPVELRAADGTGCGGARVPLYKRTVNDSDARRRVFDATLAKHDPRVTKVVMARLVTADADTALAFWHATEADEDAFHAATRVIAGNVRCSSRSRIFYDALPALWKRYPARRGLLAYTARKFSFGGGASDGDFGTVFTPLTQAELTSTLAEEDDPLRELPNVWPTLGKSWSRMDVIEPRLDGWLAADRYRSDTSWTQTLRAVASAMCDEHGTADLGRLHAWLVRRATAHASERGALERATELSAAGGCPKAPATIH